MEPNKHYAIDLLTRINALQHNGKDISLAFIEGKYSRWAFQQFFLLSQIEEFSKTKDFSNYIKRRKPRYGTISIFFVILFEVVTVFFTILQIMYVRIHRPRVITFSSDFLDASTHLNPRLRNIYSYFHAKNISYVEILHVTTVRNFLINIWKRGGLSIYLEAFNTVSRAWTFVSRKTNADDFVKELDLQNIHEDERKFVEYLIAEAVEKIQVAKINSVIIQAFLRFSGVREYVSADDFRYIPELLLACEREHIPSYVFQHSNFGYLTGMYLLPPQIYIFPLIFFTWNAYWKRRIKEISPFFSEYGSRIEIGGRSFTPAQPVQVIRKKLDSTRDSISVLIPYEVSVSRDQIIPYTSQLLGDSRIRIFFVLRGTIDQIDYGMQLDKYFTSEHQKSPQLVVVEPSGRQGAVENCNVIAGVYSGFLDESIETGVPICVFMTDFLTVNRLDEDNLASTIDYVQGNIYDQLRSACMTPDHILSERRERVHSGTVDIRKTLQRILE
ncbi:MAG: hypothetical protein K9M10_00545 [Candidatus Pacebacteria bacterium]|nr:hypothetical protein [Candidatus Paceibacterota bacterium]MCF7856951.1 hypothetical protein [Candidatus Paceibacterota bacterium]